MTDSNNNMDDLEKQVDELLTLCERLTHDKSSLQGTIADMRMERSTLKIQKDKARLHIEGMITRLKSMEKSS